MLFELGGSLLYGLDLDARGGRERSGDRRIYNNSIQVVRLENLRRGPAPKNTPGGAGSSPTVV